MKFLSFFLQILIPIWRFQRPILGKKEIEEPIKGFNVENAKRDDKIEFLVFVWVMVREDKVI